MFLRFPAFDHPALVHAITTRQGGVSAAPYDLLNLSWARPDDPRAVLENRRRVCQALEIPLEGLVQAGQIHAADVRRVGLADRGAGARERASVLAPADGLWTTARDLYLLACFADCVPLLFWDPVVAAVGIAHAGWRGTVQGMAPAMVTALARDVGTQPADLRVVVGPSAGPCCYSVGDEVVTAVRRQWPDHPELLPERNGTIFFDLWAANRLTLLAAGVLPHHITIAAHCTIDQSDRFFSHRATGGATGRFGAIIGLRSESA